MPRRQASRSKGGKQRAADTKRCNLEMQREYAVAAHNAKLAKIPSEDVIKLLAREHSLAAETVCEIVHPRATQRKLKPARHSQPAS